jgi:sulfatase maturation enzyme AslB (radical SAM superfamily)
MEKLIPSRIQIETVAGLCNYRCIMCPVEQSRRKEIMSNEIFSKVLQRLELYQANQEFLALVGMGETLIDKQTHEKIALAAAMGFRGKSIYTNGELLTEDVAEKLLASGLDSLIVSIDGFTAKIQATIRRYSNLEKVVRNVEYFLKIRNGRQAKTRIVIRFNRQKINRHEELKFLDFWKKKLNSVLNDYVSVHDVHNVGATVPQMGKSKPGTVSKKVLKCIEIYDRMMIGSDGCMSLCCGDQFRVRHDIGSVLDTDPIALYNAEPFLHYRKLMDEGKLIDSDLCKNCSVAYSIATKKVVGD